VGTSSSTHTITITNTGNADLSSISVAISGNNAGDFKTTSDTCSDATVHAGSTCQIAVQLKPSATGSRTASVDITDNAGDSPQHVPLIGNGYDPSSGFSSSPTSLSFGDQKQFTDSAEQKLTITNNGTLDLSISSVGTSGDNGNDFVVSTDGCSGVAVKQGQSCVIGVRFRPLAVGARSGSVTFTDNAFASPQSITMTGNGIVGSGPTVGQGYWTFAADGGVFTFGQYTFHGSLGSTKLNAPIVGMAGTADRGGYWLVGADGGVFSYGNATFMGSMGGKHLNSPIVAIMATPDGGGYWLVAADGGIFSYGDAAFYGSAGGIKLAAPVVGASATPTGRGYWLVAKDGGIFAYGDAKFQGSMGGKKLNKPIVGMASSLNGYWLDASDGGIFAFGAPFLGSMGGRPLNQPVVGMTATPTGQGYWLDASDGGIFTFGDGTFAGSMGGQHLNKPMIGMAS
jgi:hypothetical protein